MEVRRVVSAARYVETRSPRASLFRESPEDSRRSSEISRGRPCPHTPRPMTGCHWHVRQMWRVTTVASSSRIRSRPPGQTLPFEWSDFAPVNWGATLVEYAPKSDPDSDNECFVVAQRLGARRTAPSMASSTAASPTTARPGTTSRVKTRLARFRWARPPAWEAGCSPLPPASARRRPVAAGPAAPAAADLDQAAQAAVRRQRPAPAAALPPAGSGPRVGRGKA